MKVTVVSDARAIWGSELSILNLAPHLAERGVRLTLACPPGEFARAGAELGLPHAPLALPPRGGARRHPVRDLVRDARGIPAGARRIAYAARGADVLHSNNLLTHPDVALAGRRAGIPTVLELHDIVAAGPATAALSAAAALAGGVVAVSSAAAAGIRGPGRRRTQVLPQAVDVERYSPGATVPSVRAELGGGPLLVAIIGRVDPSKGVHRLVRAAADIADVHVAVVGRPSIDSGAYAQQVQDEGLARLAGRFTYAGQRSDIVDVLRTVDVVVNLSDAEPFGLSVLEAMSCGVPVLAARTGGLVDFVVDGVNGLLVDPTDNDAIVTALQLLRDPALRSRLGAGGRATVLAEHTIETRADSLAALYRSVAAHRSLVAAS